MIARSHKVSTDKDRFLELLPTIQEQAHHAFRCEPPERQEEMIAEVVANAFVAFVRLVDRGLGDVVYPTPLARFAVRQVRSGRKVGGSLNVNDVSSSHEVRRSPDDLASPTQFIKQVPHNKPLGDIVSAYSSPAFPGHSHRRYSAGTDSVNHTPFSDCQNLYPSRHIRPDSTTRITGRPRRCPTLLAVSTSGDRWTY